MTKFLDDLLQIWIDKDRKAVPNSNLNDQEVIMSRKENVYRMIENVTREAMDCGDREKVCRKKDTEELVLAAGEESFATCLELLENRISFYKIMGEEDEQHTQELEIIHSQVAKLKSQLSPD